MAEHLVGARLFDVEDLAPEGKNGLGRAVAPALGSAPGGVALYQVDLAQLGVLLSAVGELAGQSAAVHRVLSDDEVAGLPGGLARPLRGEALVDDLLSVGGIVLEVELDGLGNDAFDCVRTSGLPSLPLVWPSNCGSVSLTLMTAVSPSRVSSPARLESFSFMMFCLRP